MKRYEEAAGHLTKAVKHSAGWNQLELAVRRLLIECFEHNIPSSLETNEGSDTLASMILDSYFNAKMSSFELRRALQQFLHARGGESLKWYHESIYDADASLPFSFAVSFPWKTQATAGDTVEASVLIKSNLDYAVHINSVDLLTLAGKLSISSNDLMRAANASEGSDGGIIVQAKTTVTVSTHLKLPSDTSAIASDDSGNGGEREGTAGKGSFATSARPRSAAITAAGGARLLLESPNQNQNTQGWDLTFLGGKPFFCDGLFIVFCPVQAENTDADSTTLIELTLKKKKPRTAANIKRTPFEEENYIASAWSRPPYLPLSRGPRSLRVCFPRANMTISNVTEGLTKQKAVEGTVNRVVLKLQPGAAEHCINMKVSVSCFSVLITATGTVKRLVSTTEIKDEDENSLDMTDPNLRTPILVQQQKGKEEEEISSFGYELPPEWTLAGTGQDNKDIELQDVGSPSFVHLDFFRPTTLLYPQVEFTNSEMLADVSQCKTDYYVTVSYQQKRPDSKKEAPARRRRGRNVRQPPANGQQCDEPPPSEVNKDIPTEYDKVSLEYNSSLLWTRPLTAKINCGSQRSLPSERVQPSESDANDGNAPVFALNGEIVPVTGSITLEPSMEDLQVELVSVKAKVRVHAVSGSPLTAKDSREPIFPFGTALSIHKAVSLWGRWSQHPFHSLRV